MQRKRADISTIDIKQLRYLKKLGLSDVEVGKKLNCCSDTIWHLRELHDIPSTKPRHHLKKHPLYRKYYDILTRCYNSNRKDYKNYGGKGVKIDPEWASKKHGGFEGSTGFLNFFKWAITSGYKPGLSIARKYDTGNYCPDNCYWISKSQNMKEMNKNRLTKAFLLGYICGQYDKDCNRRCKEREVKDVKPT